MKKIFLVSKESILKINDMINIYNKSLVTYYLKKDTESISKSNLEEQKTNIINYLNKNNDFDFKLDVEKIQRLYSDDHRINNILNNNILKEVDIDELIYAFEESSIDIEKELLSILKYAKVQKSNIITFYI